MGDIMDTRYFKAIQDEKQVDAKTVLHEVYAAIKEKGYDPINQMVGYLMSGDPIYIPRHNGARSLITKVDRDEIVEELMRVYVEKELS